MNESKLHQLLEDNLEMHRLHKDMIKNINYQLGILSARISALDSRLRYVENRLGLEFENPPS